MKNGKNPTRRQKAAIKAAGFNPDNWLVFKSEASTLHIIHRNTGTTKIIHI
ncbi:hypothetical protein E6C60_3064 [Paenibacillus algicola]|uniref:DUF6906 domain-containing protein n=1 Tax=Paenibacillus algicola TaxID=2565926 RepID=A0A4P8XNC6_9BACL|nr:hypothetical protein [Paenibacillus algicola]QCT03775.1 hypothetical protein E6C60_3064 [Paenibacillus algicola]